MFVISKLAMKSVIVKSGAYQLEVVSPPSGKNSLISALLEQYGRSQRSSVDYEIKKFRALEALIHRKLQEIGCYHDFIPQLVQQPEIYRALVSYLQHAIEIRFPDGLVRTYPKLYRIDEPIYRLFCDNKQYYSVVEVRLTRLLNLLFFQENLAFPLPRFIRVLIFSRPALSCSYESELGTLKVGLLSDDKF